VREINRLRYGKKSSFCEQKEAKKLRQLERGPKSVRSSRQKFFASFFQKRCFLLPFNPLIPNRR